jgi:hypothetical protein
VRAAERGRAGGQVRDAPLAAGQGGGDAAVERRSPPPADAVAAAQRADDAAHGGRGGVRVPPRGDRDGPAQPAYRCTPHTVEPVRATDGADRLGFSSYDIPVLTAQLRRSAQLDL